MAVSINWATKVITIPQADLTPVSGSLYELDVDWLRLQLKDIEDSDIGMSFPDTHRHNTQVTLSGVTYARTFEIVNGYTVEFEDGQYTVRCVGANHNLADVKVANQASLIVGNSAGLIQGGGGASAGDIVAALLAAVVDSGLTVAQTLRALNAFAHGDATGLEGSNPQFKSPDGTKTRINATYNSGTRTVTGRDLS